MYSIPRSLGNCISEKGFFSMKTYRQQLHHTIACELFEPDGHHWMNFDLRMTFRTMRRPPYYWKAVVAAALHSAFGLYNPAVFGRSPFSVCDCSNIFLARKPHFICCQFSGTRYGRRGTRKEPTGTAAGSPGRVALTSGPHLHGT